MFDISNKDNKHHNLKAEKAILSFILFSKNKIDKIIESIDKEDFYNQAHLIIFEIILELYEKNIDIDLISIHENLVKKEQLAIIGGYSSLVKITKQECIPQHIDRYIEIIKEKSTLRKIKKAATKVLQLTQSDKEVIDILNESEELFYEINRNNRKNTYSTIQDLLLETFDYIEEVSKNDKKITGVSSGFYDLDKMTSGFQDENLIIIAARPSMGKTALALDIARHVAVEEGLSVGIFSLEMSKLQLTERLLCAESCVDSQRLRTGYLTETDWQRLTDGAGILNKAEIYIDDTPAINSQELKIKAKRIKNKHNLDLILIDYLQLMTSNKGYNRQEEISRISRSLKELARELGIPVITLSQLSRAVEQRNDKRPQLSDLRSSGSIEQDADIVAFIYRDDYYNLDSSKKGITEIIIGKQRNGPVGVIELGFQKEYAKFVNLKRTN